MLLRIGAYQGGPLVDVGPSVLNFVCIADMWAHSFYYFFSRIELPRKRHVNAAWDKDLVKLAT